MSEQKCRKVYVPVNLDVDAEGNIRPRLIRWIDGRVYEIDRLKHKCRASSTKVGGCGIRYTVMIGGHESFLFNEDEKWFVEALLLCLNEPFFIFVVQKALRSTDHDRITDSAATYLRGSNPTLMLQSVDLIHPSINPSNQAQSDIPICIHIQIHRYI